MIATGCHSKTDINDGRGGPKSLKAKKSGSRL